MAVDSTTTGVCWENVKDRLPRRCRAGMATVKKGKPYSTVYVTSGKCNGRRYYAICDNQTRMGDDTGVNNGV